LNGIRRRVGVVESGVVPIERAFRFYNVDGQWL
jgi:hypothetical protein